MQFISVQALEEALPETAVAFMRLIWEHAQQLGDGCAAASHLLHTAAACQVDIDSATQTAVGRLTDALRLLLHRTGQMPPAGKQAAG